jgi:hypothetical protein
VGQAPDHRGHGRRGPHRSNVVAFIPDPKSRSGKSNRFIGFSPTAERVLIVIVVDHDGRQYGANCWLANPTDRRIYRERNTQ